MIDDRRARAPTTPSQLAIRAARDETGLWRTETMDALTGVVAAKTGIDPDSRIGRALEALATQLRGRRLPVSTTRPAPRATP